MKAKIIILLVLCTVFIASFALGAYAYGSSSYFDGTPIPVGELLTDRDDLISAEDEIAIISALSTAEEKCNAAVRAYVYSGDFYFDYENYIYNSVSKPHDLILLVIQYDSYYDEYFYYFDTYGDAYSAITDKEVDRILDNPEVYDNIKSGNLKDGIVAYASLAERAYVGKLRPNFGTVLKNSIIISLIVAAIASISVYAMYKRKLHAESYPLERYASLNLKLERDSFINKIVTRTRISSSSGGGRSGGGRSGGGRRGGR